MKSAILSLLPVLASASVLDTRQLSGLFGKGTELKRAWVRDLKPTVRPDAVHQLVGYGPVDLKAGMKGRQQSHMFQIKSPFCSSCTVLKGKAGLEIKGSKIPDDKTVYIHHILTNDMSKPTKPFISGCTTSTSPPASSGKSGKGGIGLGSKFIGTGDDQSGIYAWYTSRDGKLDAGFHIGAGDTFFQNVDLVNNSDDAKQVYITMEIEYLKGAVGPDTRDILLSVGGCGSGQIKTSTTGPTNTTSARFYFLEDGQIIYAKGHLHAGGESMYMFINGKFVCESQATYKKGNDAGITGISICPTAIPVKKGDYLTMTGKYDASKHNLRHEGMGGMGGGMADVMAMWAFSFVGLK